MLKSIRSKLISVISLITLLVIGIFSYIILDHQNQQLIAEAIRGANILSETVTRSTRYEMLLNNREHLHRMIETIGEQPGIDVIRIFNKEGKIMFSADKMEMENYVDKNAEACYICHAAEEPLEHISSTERSRIFQTDDDRILATITPIFNEPDCYNAPCHAHSEEQNVLGVLDIGMSLNEVDNDFKRNRVMVIIFTLIAILSISSILILFLNILVTKPVIQLAEATKKVAKGDLDVEINVTTNDEISYLGMSFNHMINDLKTANQKIKTWNIELERQVKERTEKLRMTREHLLQSEKMVSLGVLTSSVAHEINNPLQGIFTYIKLMIKILANKELDREQVTKFKSYLDLMGPEIERCGDIVKNLLVFSRQSKPEIRRANVNEIIKSSLILLENKIRIHNIETNLKLQENISSIYCDFKQIQQTLIAFIINALEAMSDGGKLSITTQCQNNDKVDITITDTGSGISKENLKNIFDPFFTTKEDAKSTGLGLFVAYGIIQEHKGSIDVVSEVEKGTEFHISLPIETM